MKMPLLNTATKKKDSKNATSALCQLLAWWFFCHHIKFLLVYVMPLMPLLYYCYTPQKSSHLSLVEWCQEQSHQHWYRFRTWYISHHPPHLFLVGLYSYIVWVTLHQLLSTRSIMMTFGFFVFTQSQGYVRIVLPSSTSTTKLGKLIQFMLPLSSSSSQGSRQHQQEKLVQRALNYQQHYMIDTLHRGNEREKEQSDPFTFVIYENQRRSPLTNKWHAFTLPVERNTWSDEYHHSVLPKQQFILPSPVQLKDEQRKGTIIWTWVWVDSDWRLADEEGHAWEYSDLIWTPSSLATLQASWLGSVATRRRKWNRRAILECTFHSSSSLSSSLTSGSAVTSSVLSNTSTLPASSQRQQQQQQQQRRHPLVIDTPLAAYQHQPSVSSPSPSIASPISPQTSMSAVSLHDYQRRANETVSSQVSLFSTKTNGSINDDWSLSRQATKTDSKRSSKSTRRQAVWKSIVSKT